MEINPEHERQRLIARYADMPLDKLQKIATDWHELTEIARETLEAEIRRRGASIPEEVKAPKVAPPPAVIEEIVPEEPTEEIEEEEENDALIEVEPDNSPGPKLVLIRSFRDLPEALLAQGSLESAGIASFLVDGNTVRMDWFWSNAVGGVKLMVSPEDADEAIAILDQPIPENFEISDGQYQQPRCPQCNSLDVSFEELNKPIAYTSAYVRIPLPVHDQGWKCHACKHHWDAPAEQASTGS